MVYFNINRKKVMVCPSYNKKSETLLWIEGQVCGLQKMIEEKRYCVDVLTQISSVNAALLRGQDRILEGHLNGYLTSALKGKSEIDRQNKISEIFGLLKKFKKNG